MHCGDQIARHRVFVAAALLAAGGCTSTHDRPAPRPQLAATSTTIGFGAGITLTTADVGRQPGMSAADAWRRYARDAGSDRRAIASDVRTILGRLTGSGEADRLVWAYELRRPVGCLYTISAPPHSHRPKRCTEWTFLDADSGKHVLTTFRPVAGTTDIR